MPVVKSIIPSLGISKLTMSKFDAYIFDKITKITGNTNFPLTVPPIIDVQKTYDAYHPLQAAGRNLLSADRIIRDELGDTLKSDITSLAWNCSALSAGDLKMYATTGFGARGKGVPYNDLLPSPTNTVVNTKKGEGVAEVTSDVLPYSKNFNTRYGLAGTDPSTWKTETGDRIQMLEGTPGVAMELQRAGNGKKGTGFFCKKVPFTFPFD